MQLQTACLVKRPGWHATRVLGIRVETLFLCLLLLPCSVGGLLIPAICAIILFLVWHYFGKM